MRARVCYAYTTVLVLQFGLLVYVQNQYDTIYSLVTTSDMDTFWHPNNSTSITRPHQISNRSFNHDFVVVTACGRDVHRFLPYFRRNMESILTVFQDYRILLGESDSADNTLAYMKNWSLTNSKVFTYTYGNLTNSYSTRRTDRIAYCRNHLLDKAREKHWLSRSQFLLVADIDVNANSVLSLDNFLTNFDYNLDEWGALMASQSMRYYDIWALRSPVVHYDCWKEVLRYPRYSEIASKIYIEIHTKPIPKDHDLIPVQSAFGGFGIYQTRYLSNCTYDSSDGGSYYGKCEHVSFNECVHRNGGQIFINPAFQNSDGLPT